MSHDHEPIAGFDALAFLQAFQAAANAEAGGGNVPPDSPGTAAAATTTRGTGHGFFPEGATCSVCDTHALYSHTAAVMYCCGTAICKVSISPSVGNRLHFLCLC